MYIFLSTRLVFEWIWEVKGGLGIKHEGLHGLSLPNSKPTAESTKAENRRTWSLRLNLLVCL